METILEYYNKTDKYPYVDSVLTNKETISGTKEEIFKEFYAKNNRLRYCNGSYYKFEDEALEKEYYNWLKILAHNIIFDMYYGNGIVD